MKGVKEEERVRIVGVEWFGNEKAVWMLKL